MEIRVRLVQGLWESAFGPLGLRNSRINLVHGSVEQLLRTHLPTPTIVSRPIDLLWSSHDASSTERVR